MTAVPTLPFVVLNAHKPYSANDIVDAVAAAISAPSSAAIIAAQSSNFLPPQAQTHASRSASTDTAPTALSPLSTVAGGAFSSISASISRTGPINHTPSSSKPNNGANISRDSVTSTLSPSTIQTRTIHPQVHYIFEDDPLEGEILEAIPKSRCITLDLDPRSGSIKNVESFLTNLQVMDVKLVPFQAALTTSSSSSSSLNSLTNNVTGSGNTNTAETNDTENNGGGGIRNAALGRVGSSGSSSLQSSMTISTTKTGGRLLERSLANQAAGGGESDIQKNLKNDERATTTPSAAGTKDWTLVIEAVEVEERDPDSDSEILDQSMASSLDTDLMHEDYLPHCDALLKSFSARNLLVQKVIDYASTNSSLNSSGGSQ